MTSLLLSENLLSLTLHADLLIDTHYWHSPTFRHGSLLPWPSKATMAKRQFFKHQRVKNIKIPHIRIQSAFKYWTLFRYKINSKTTLIPKEEGVPTNPQILPNLPTVITASKDDHHQPLPPHTLPSQEVKSIPLLLSVWAALTNWTKLEWHLASPRHSLSKDWQFLLSPLSEPQATV